MSTAPMSTAWRSPAEAPSANAVPAAGTAAPGGTEATVKGSPEAAPPSAQRLRPGALRALIHAWLAERPGQDFTPTRISKELGRSAGAVGNALATMSDQGEVIQTSRKPRRYAIAEGE
jgi:nitric oxide reductase NorQ protein